MKRIFLFALGLMMAAFCTEQANAQLQESESDRDFGVGRLIIDDGGEVDEDLTNLIISLGNDEDGEGGDIIWVLPDTEPNEGDVLLVDDVDGNIYTLIWDEIDPFFQGESVGSGDAARLDQLIQLIEAQQAQIEALQARIEALEGTTEELELTTEEGEIVDSL